MFTDYKATADFSAHHESELEDGKHVIVELGQRADETTGAIMHVDNHVVSLKLVTDADLICMHLPKDTNGKPRYATDGRSMAYMPANQTFTMTGDRVRITENASAA